MDIYAAISDFTPPISDGTQNILDFKKGDTFEIFDCHKTDADWWGARALTTNTVGYVPSRYMKFEKKKIEKLLPDNYQSQREESLRHLSNMENSPESKAPEDVIPDTPVPDYDDGATPNRYSANIFAEKFKTVLSSIRKIEDMYDDQDEPEPDYNDEGEAEIIRPVENGRSGSQSSEEGLVLPKKLANPCVESSTRQALHKELLFNYKKGVNVLEKPELNKVLSQRRETQRKKEWEDQKKASRTSLEMQLEKRANKMKEEDEMKTISENEEKPEFQQVLARLSQKSKR